MQVRTMGAWCSICTAVVVLLGAPVAAIFSSRLMQPNAAAGASAYEHLSCASDLFSQIISVSLVSQGFEQFRANVC
jgi:hypothetical protein